MKSDNTKSDITPRVIKLIHSVLNYYIVYSEINEAELGKMKKKLTLLDPLGLFCYWFPRQKNSKKGKSFQEKFFIFFFQFIVVGSNFSMGLKNFSSA